MALHLVPPPEAPGARPRRGRHGTALSLTPEENRHLRAAIRNAARSYGGHRGLARAMGLALGALSRRRHGPAFAVALWRLTGLPLDVILRGTLAAVQAPREPDRGPAA